jgi:hypothetical protein
MAQRVDLTRDREKEANLSTDSNLNGVDMTNKSGLLLSCIIAAPAFEIGCEPLVDNAMADIEWCIASPIAQVPSNTAHLTRPSQASS